MREAAAEAKVELGVPALVDEETELFDIIGSHGRLSYYYRLVNYLASDFEPGAFIAELAPIVTANVCANPQQKAILDLGGAYVYKYIGRDANTIGSFTITASDCAS